ncbi:MAG: hypothetical protein LBG96_02430 [Tannerella sp.]|jgi:alpha-glucosidase (family GH31 glycosyl hydrolase)|nr:hypothetical protein [Tannerella sp.]
MKITNRRNFHIEYNGTRFQYQKYSINNKTEVIKLITKNPNKLESSETFYIYTTYENPEIINTDFKIKEVNGKVIGFSIYKLKTRDNQKKKIYFDTSFTLGYFGVEKC